MARLEGGIRNKAARGELRRGLPVGFVYGEQDGEVRFHPDASVVGAIRTVFERFAELGSPRQVWLWFRTQGFERVWALAARETSSSTNSTNVTLSRLFGVHQ